MGRQGLTSDLYSAAPVIVMTLKSFQNEAQIYKNSQSFHKYAQKI